MDLEQILTTIQPFLVMFVALTAAFMTAIWVSVVIWAFRDIRSRSRDVFAQILATLMVLLFFPLFPLPGLILYLFLRPRETLAEVYERSLEEETLLQGIQERVACPSCNRRIEEDFIVCPSCQTRLKKPCQACGRLLHLRWTICPYCAAPQVTTQPAPALRPQPAAVAVEAAATAPRLSPGAQSSLPEPGAEREPEAEPVWEPEWSEEEEFSTPPEGEEFPASLEGEEFPAGFEGEEFSPIPEEEAEPGAEEGYEPSAAAGPEEEGEEPPYKPT
jgi:RNA polymerase subunit RPABC4/transcription elongation factor Spt4